MIRSHLSTYTDDEKMEILDEYLSSGLPMDVIQRKYHMGHCTISKWLSKFELSNFRETQFKTMAENRTNSPYVSKSRKELELEEKIKNLEKELKLEKLKTLALETVIDVAEKELKIDIRKKAGAKR
ncbi:MAG TPA: hypothetical protein DF637_05610 [Rikenellaceae bacterium]|nr:MAG: hypothetical protein A2491_07960 [Bacteroidetes bacterium RIFOXYC12_FULL_35_7]OFZ10610.1 MAG: hypothetical protein A2465_08175 [Bacteroidetes bacterium RIFOXYC2_FULL_39_11]HCV15791.1 hypothetical protein [Rikenellaceae bacterium]